LPPLLPTADNAAVQTDPPKADQPKRKRRWFQFSLRSLMIAVAVLCCVMAVVNSRANQQRRVAQRIKDAHGLVFYDYQLDDKLNMRTDDPQPLGPVWLRQVIGLDFFATVVSVRVNLASDEYLDAAAELPDLRDLRIACDSKISDRAWENLTRLTSLESLYLRGIRDSAMSNLRGLSRLRLLDITNTDITDAGLVNLKGLKGLRTLNLGGTKVTDAGVASLRAALPNCRIADRRGR
jgi:hypothetical protein